MERDAVIVAGFGCSTRADLGSLRAAYAATGAKADALACPEARRAQLAPLAEALGVALIALPDAALRGVATPTQSARSLAAFGTGSVAEACALLAAGPGAVLRTPRVVARDGLSTCAIAARKGT